MTTADKENQLIEEAKQNSEQFAVLYDRYIDPIYRYVARRVKDQATAEDITSQTFLDALANLGKYQDRGFPFSSWLYKIAHNNVLKHYRLDSRSQTVDLEEIAELKDNGENIEESLDANYEKLTIEVALEKLEPEEKEILKLKYFEEISNLEIAEVMGITANNVGVKLFRALKRLKQLI